MRRFSFPIRAAPVLLATLLALPAAPAAAAPLSCGGLVVTIAGTAGDDTIAGTSGPDVIFGRQGADVIYGLGGDDVLCGGTGNDVLIGGPGNDTLIGNGGVDTASYADSPAAVTVRLGARRSSGGAGTDTLRTIANVIGSDFDDLLVGNGRRNVLDGGAGDDHLIGKGGNDVLRGRAGDDELEGRKGDDALNGGAGVDTATYRGAKAGVVVDLGSGTATGGDGQDSLSAVESVIGSRHADTLGGDPGDNFLNGHRGNDVLRGRGGEDRLLGGAGADVVNGGGGYDVCAAESAAACENRPAEARRLLELANELRLAYGVAPLAWEPVLAAVAQAHAVDMYANDFFSHVSPTTGGPGDRLDAAGVVWQVRGEIIAIGPGPAVIHAAWLGSSGHRAAMLRSAYGRAGFGVVAGPDGMMAVAVFVD